MRGHAIELGERDVGFQENLFEALDGLRLGVHGVDERSKRRRAILRKALQYVGSGAREKEGVVRSDGEFYYMNRIVQGQVDIYPPVDADLHLNLRRCQPMVYLSNLMGQLRRIQNIISQLCMIWFIATH